MIDKRNKTAPLILDILQTIGPMTCPEIREATGTTSSSTCRQVKRLMDDGLIHRSGWRRMVGRQGKEAAIYSFGPGHNARRPDFRQASAERKLEWQREMRRGKAKLSRLQSLGDNPFRALIIQTVPGHVIDRVARREAA